MIKIYSTPNETVKKFAEYLEELINKTTSKKKNFYIALSGGSTPQRLFKELRINYSKSIDWEFVHIFWGDERCVDPKDDESNYRITNKLLLSKIEIPEENIHRIKGEEIPSKEARRYSGEILMNVPTRNKLPKFDLVILGLGTDGHTASIFPNQIELLESENYCEVAVHPESKQKRITITGNVINNADEIVFLVTGKEKSVIISDIINKESEFNKYPASYIQPNWGKLKWFLDNKASCNLK